MFLEKLLDFWRSMIGCPINKENDFLDFVSLSVVYEVREMSPEFDVSPSVETIPHDFLFWPEKCDKTIDSFRIAWRCDLYYLSFWHPSSL
jgi:hypothetical protein